MELACAASLLGQTGGGNSRVSIPKEIVHSFVEALMSLPQIAMRGKCSSQFVLDLGSYVFKLASAKKTSTRQVDSQNERLTVGRHAALLAVEKPKSKSDPKHDAWLRIVTGQSATIVTDAEIAADQDSMEVSVPVADREGITTATAGNLSAPWPTLDVAPSCSIAGEQRSDGGQLQNTGINVEVKVLDDWGSTCERWERAVDLIDFALHLAPEAVVVNMR